MYLVDLFENPEKKAASIIVQLTDDGWTVTNYGSI